MLLDSHSLLPGDLRTNDLSACTNRRLSTRCGGPTLPALCMYSYTIIFGFVCKWFWMVFSPPKRRKQKAGKAGLQNEKQRCIAIVTSFLLGSISAVIGRVITIAAHVHGITSRNHYSKGQTGFQSKMTIRHIFASPTAAINRSYRRLKSSSTACNAGCSS